MTTFSPDPCIRAEELRQLRLQIATGGSLTHHRYRQLEEERESRYSAVSLSDLDSEIREAERLCALQTGVEPPRRRSAIRGVRKGY